MFNHSNTGEESSSSSMSIFLNVTTKYQHYNSSNTSAEPTEAVIIAFQIGRIISILCVIFGLPGNITLIVTIFRSSFCHFPYGLLLLFLATFDIIRLLSATFYYLIQAHCIPLTLSTATIYVVFYRYPRFITNWLKVFLAIERLIAVKYWIENRYDINSNNGKRINHLRQRKLLLLIVLLLLCALISQHPNFLSARYISVYVDPHRLLIMKVLNRSFYYGNQIFNGFLFTIISYIIIDDLLPIITLILCNTILLHELRHLPKLTSRKLSESILILFFLTLFSIFIIPKSFLAIFNLYANQDYIDDTVISVISHTFQGLEMINHAITGYACFLSCQTLRKDLLRNVRKLTEKFRWRNDRLDPSTIESSSIPPKRS